MEAEKERGDEVGDEKRGVEKTKHTDGKKKKR